jgi:CheY-like chemotaxis protein
MAPHAPNTRHLNILAVDDEAGSRAALSLMLALAGHHALIAEGAGEALKLYDETGAPFDLVITDHMMPEMSGIDFVKKLRERGFAGGIIVLGSYVETMDQQEYQQLGVVGVITKPFDTGILRQWAGSLPEDCLHPRCADPPPSPDPY